MRLNINTEESADKKGGFLSGPLGIGAAFALGKFGIGSTVALSALGLGGGIAIMAIGLAKAAQMVDGLEFDGLKNAFIKTAEGLEHFDTNHQLVHINNLKKFLKPDGRLIVSVPLETGLSALFKNLARSLSGQTHNNTTLTNVLRSVFGLNVERQGDPYIYSHIGFNHKPLERLFEQQNLVVVRKHFSPIPFLGGLLNSQIFYILENKKAS